MPRKRLDRGTNAPRKLSKKGGNAPRRTKDASRSPAYLVFALSLIVMTASAILLLSECWERYATARYWRGVAQKRADLSDACDTPDILPAFRSV